MRSKSGCPLYLFLFVLRQAQHDKQKKDATAIRARLLHFLEVSVEADFLIFGIFRHYAGFLVLGHTFFEEIGFPLQ